jgi:pyruvate/2-oxoglutarate dehydrogenase complex dihydrolipoamide dehydrogenase (E3) component
LQVDDTMLAPAEGEWLYAVGDTNGRNLLTHMGKYQARICIRAIVARMKGLPVETDLADAIGAPQAIFTDPQVIAVGLTESAARSKGFNVKTVEIDISNVVGADLQADDYKGKAKMVVDEDRKVLIGVTFAGPGIVDHLHAATIAVAAQVPLDRLWHAVPAFPTTSEIWLQLLEGYGL